MNKLRKFLGLCVHRWIIINQGNITYDRTNIITGKYYDLQCENCGNMKTSKLMA